MRRLIDQDGVFAIVGTLHSPIISATAPDRRRECSANGWCCDRRSWCNEVTKYVWRRQPTRCQCCSHQAALQESDSSNLGVLYQNDDYGASGAESLEAIDGIEVVASETYNAYRRP